MLIVLENQAIVMLQAGDNITQALKLLKIEKKGNIIFIRKCIFMEC